MGCTKCKKKTTLSATTELETLLVAEVISKYKLRIGISWEQLGLSSPTESEIEKFLKVNPNRKSLFSIMPDNMENGMRKE